MHLERRFALGGLGAAAVVLHDRGEVGDERLEAVGAMPMRRLLRQSPSSLPWRELTSKVALLHW